MERNPQNEITAELMMLESRLAQWPRTVPFAWPADYFALFPADIFTIIQAAESENDPQLSLPKALPFEMPEGYFENFIQEILPEVIPSFGHISKEPPFAVPEGYFNDFIENVLPEVTPVFTKVGTDMPFEVPEGYFKRLPAQLLQAAKNTEAAPAERTNIIPLIAPWKAIRWAAAAMLVLGLGLGSYRIYNGYHTPDRTALNQLASVNKDSLSSYVDQNVDDFDAETLETNVAANNAIALNDINKNDFNKIDKQEIIQYLDDNGWDDKSAD